MSSLETFEPVPISVKAFLSNTSTRYVRLIWVDYINFVRYRVLPLKKFKALLEFSRSDLPRPSLEHEDGRKVLTNPNGGISITKAALGLVYIALADGFGPTGEFIYVPDPNSASVQWHAEHQIGVMGWFEEKECELRSFLLTAVGASPQDKERLLFRSPLCPRYALERVLFDAEEQGISFLIGFESEVIFLTSVDPIKACNDQSWSVSQALPTGSPETRAVEEIADILTRNGLLDMYHSEAAPGQYEFITVPDTPLRAVDALIFTRETIRNIASKHGLHATFAPRIYTHTCGSASHVHISLTSTNPSHKTNTTSTSPLSPLYASFLQGLLTHLPSTCIFTLPTPFSYARAIDGIWSGGTYVAWGRDNRETPVRLCGRGADDPNLNFEVKCLDATANPYLAISALLAAGLDGVKNGAQLEVGMCQVPPYLMTDVERAKKGVTKRLPLNVEDARDALRSNEVIQKALGEELVEKFLAVNETLARQLQAFTPEKALINLVKTY